MFSFQFYSACNFIPNPLGNAAKYGKLQKLFIQSGVKVQGSIRQTTILELFRLSSIFIPVLITNPTKISKAP
jgi:hypothetical protein